MATIKTSCVNGDLRLGDYVLSVSGVDYGNLVGYVSAIDGLGTPEHTATHNKTDDIHVRFDAEVYSDQRVREIEAAFTEMYGEPKTFDDLPLDDVIMAPYMLINLTALDISREEFQGLLNSEEQAAALCSRVLEEVGATDRDRQPEGGRDGSAAEPLTQKLYSPISVEVGGYGEGDEDEYSTYTMSGENAAYYLDEIHAAILRERSPEEARRGLMAYYHGGGSVDEKVLSATIDVDVHGGKLWGVATLELAEPLANEELDALKEYLIGQYSDGFGEGFEQRAVKIDGEDKELFVHLWQSDDGFFIESEQAFAQRLGIVTPPVAQHTDATKSAPVSTASVPVAPVTAEPLGGSVVGGAMTTEKLYSPLEFYLHHPREEEESGEYGMYDMYDERYKVSHDDVWDSMDAIELTLRRDVDRLDRTHGLAEYLPDELRAKVWSLFPAIEPIGDSLYFAATVELTAPLTAQETALLKEEISGQWSDGFGEGLEQREVKIGRDSELYIVPWSSGDGFFIDTEREFRQRLGLEPHEPPVAAVTPEASATVATATVTPDTPIVMTPEEAERDFLAVTGDAYAVYTFAPTGNDASVTRANYRFAGCGKLEGGATLDDIRANIEGGRLDGFVRCSDVADGAVDLRLGLIALKQGGVVTPWLVQPLAYSVARGFFDRGEGFIADKARDVVSDLPQHTAAPPAQNGYTSVMGIINAGKAAKQACKAEKELGGGRGDGEDAPAPKPKRKRKRGDEEI